MKFIDFLNEGKKLNKTEQVIIDMFIGNEDGEIKISWYQGTGRIIGGGAPSGEREYLASEDLVKKGILSYADLKKDREIHSNSTSRVHILKLEDKSLINYELSIEEFMLFRYIAEYRERDPHANNWFKSMSKKEEKIFKKLTSMGYVTGSKGNPDVLKDYREVQDEQDANYSGHDLRYSASLAVAELMNSLKSDELEFSTPEISTSNHKWAKERVALLTFGMYSISVVIKNNKISYKLPFMFTKARKDKTKTASTVDKFIKSIEKDLKILIKGDLI